MDIETIINDISSKSTCFGRPVDTVTIKSEMRETPPDTFARMMDQLRRWDPYFFSWNEILERMANIVLVYATCSPRIR